MKVKPLGRRALPLNKTNIQCVPAVPLLVPRQALWVRGVPDAWLPAPRPTNKIQKAVNQVERLGGVQIQKEKSSRAR